MEDYNVEAIIAERFDNKEGCAVYFWVSKKDSGTGVWHFDTFDEAVAFLFGFDIVAEAEKHGGYSEFDLEVWPDTDEWGGDALASKSARWNFLEQAFDVETSLGF